MRMRTMASALELRGVHGEFIYDLRISFPARKNLSKLDKDKLQRVLRQGF